MKTRRERTKKKHEKPKQHEEEICQLIFNSGSDRYHVPRHACISFAGDQLNPVDMKIIVDAKDPVTVKAYNASYTYNTYVSMRDMAKALSGTAKGFAMTFDEESETMVIETGEVYTPVGGENEPGDGQVGNVSFQMAKMTIDGKSVKYYGYKAGTDKIFTSKSWTFHWLWILTPIIRQRIL